MRSRRKVIFEWHLLASIAQAARAASITVRAWSVLRSLFVHVEEIVLATLFALGTLTHAARHDLGEQTHCTAPNAASKYVSQRYRA
eukprot:6863494-Alexandrium_andersonii.AAC.1